MKKLALLFLFLTTILLTGCISTQQVENDNLSREKAWYRLRNECAWQLSVSVTQKGLPSSKQTLTLGQSAQALELYKDADYVISIKGTYDSSVHTFSIHTDDKNLLVFDWSSYDAKYHLKSGKSMF